MVNWENIRSEWESSKITLKDLADKYDVKLGTLKSRKSRESWSRDATEKDATKTNKVATPIKPNKQMKRSGNPNPQNQFTERNRSAVKHGLFSRYIPQSTLEIMGMLDKSDPADLIWDQIQIQYAAIIRAQEIMFVESKDEMIKELKKEKFDNFGEGMEVIEKEYEFQFSWDRQATFLNAQSRAMGELRGMIKQFNELAYENDERRLKLEQMTLGIDKTKNEIKKLEKDLQTDTSTEDKLKEYFEALGGAFRES